MYNEEQKRFAVDLWFEMLGSMSLDDFVAELGWPSRTTLMKWIRADPRHDPDRAQYRSLPTLKKLELIQRIAGGQPVLRSAREAGISDAGATLMVKQYTEGGTIALLPKATVRAMASKDKGHTKASKHTCAPYMRKPHVPSELPDDPAALKAIIGELQLNNDVLREVLAVLKAEPGFNPGTLTNNEKATVVLGLTDKYPAGVICKQIGLARSSYYYSLDSMTTPSASRCVDNAVKEAFEIDGESARGYRFVKHIVDRRLGRPISEKVVRTSMHKQGLEVVYRHRNRKHYSSYSGEIDTAAPNLLLRADGTHDFRPKRPNTVWTSDITEFRLPGDAGKIYLSPLLDLYDGRPVAWSISPRPDAELANSSLEAACATLAPGEHPLVHTDRGCHYRWPGWKAICSTYNLTRSMSRKGTSPDNAAMEGFFGTVKNEFFYGRDWRGWDRESFSTLLNTWLSRYSSTRLKSFREGNQTVYDTIDGRRRRLGFAV